MAEEKGEARGVTSEHEEIPLSAYEVEEHVESRVSSNKWTLWLLYSTGVAIVGSSLQFGYNTTCINAPEQDIKKFFRTRTSGFSDMEWSTAVAIFAIGGMFGALTGPVVANILGRKNALLVNNIPALIGSLLMFLSYHTEQSALLIVGRLVIGVNCGINTAVAPLYLSEIAPVNLRGSLGTLNQFGIVTGLLVGFVFGLEQLLGNASGWPYLLSFSVVPSILQLITLPFCPKSPRYLLLKCNEESKAIEALQLLRGSTDVSQDIEEMKVEQDTESQEEKISVTQLFRLKELQMPLLISVVMQLSQQLSGINAVFYYSTSIFESAGVKESRAATSAIGAVSLLMTAITVKLVEVLGRRTLMLYGIGGMFVFYAVMTLSFALQDEWSGMNYISVVSTLILVASFQLGPGPIPWFITAELFSQGTRPAAVSVAGVTNWLANFLVGIGFPAMQKALHPYTFLVFMALLAIFWTFTYFLVPETKGRTIEDITAGFKKPPDRANVFYDAVAQEQKDANDKNM